MAQTCCPLGYFKDPSDGNCWNLNHVATTDARIECPCCPVGYLYNSISGVCQNITDNVDSVPTIECPCCPDGYEYISLAISPLYPNGFCQSLIKASDKTATIPCIPCDCADTVPPDCPECAQSGGLHIAFTFDTSKKQCDDCNDLQGPRMTNDCYFNNFMPYFMVDPIINFKLR